MIKLERIRSTLHFAQHLVLVNALHLRDAQSFIKCFSEAKNSHTTQIQMVVLKVNKYSQKDTKKDNKNID